MNIRTIGAAVGVAAGTAAAIGLFIHHELNGKQSVDDTAHDYMRTFDINRDGVINLGNGQKMLTDERVRGWQVFHGVTYAFVSPAATAMDAQGNRDEKVDQREVAAWLTQFDRNHDGQLNNNERNNAKGGTSQIGGMNLEVDYQLLTTGFAATGDETVRN